MNHTTKHQTTTSTATAGTASDILTTPASVPASHFHNPLALLERELLSRPGQKQHYDHHRHHHHYRSQTQTQPLATHSPDHLSPPAASAEQYSRTPSPALSTGARRSMAATAAWTPMSEDAVDDAVDDASKDAPMDSRLPDRRHSWDWQAYRHAMMVQATGLACACHACGHGHAGHVGHAGHCEMNYEANRGFSEASHQPISRG